MAQRNEYITTIVNEGCYIIGDKLNELTVTCDPILAISIILDDHEQRITALELNERQILP